MTPALLAAIGGALMTFVRLFRTDAIQTLIPQQYRWERWHALYQLAFVFGLSLAGATITALSTGLALGSALEAGIVVGLAAMGWNTATKSVGEQMTINAVAKDTTYKPSALRDALSIALPVNRDLLTKVALSRAGRTLDLAKDPVNGSKDK